MSNSKSPKTDEFCVRLEPLLRLGPAHPAVQGVRLALAGERDDLVRRSVDLGTRGEDRVWWSGAAAAVQTLIDVIDAALEKLPTEVVGDE